MDKEILRLEKVNKSFGGVHAVKDISMTIAKGELTAIIGPNGPARLLYLILSQVYIKYLPAIFSSIVSLYLDLGRIKLLEWEYRGHFRISGFSTMRQFWRM